MSERSPAHKKLVDAIVDSEATTREVAFKAITVGKTQSDKLNAALKTILQARADGRITAEKAKELWREVWITLSLAAFATVAHDVVDAEQAYARVHAEAHALGPEKMKVTPIRNADRMAREQEKRNGGTGEG